jgi:hypothetical protein
MKSVPHGPVFSAAESLGVFVSAWVNLAISRIENITITEGLVLFLGALSFFVSVALIVYCPMESTVAFAIGDNVNGMSVAVAAIVTFVYFVVMGVLYYFTEPPRTIPAVVFTFIWLISAISAISMGSLFGFRLLAGILASMLITRAFATFCITRRDAIRAWIKGDPILPVVAPHVSSQKYARE